VGSLTESLHAFCLVEFYEKSQRRPRKQNFSKVAKIFISSKITSNFTKNYETVACHLSIKIYGICTKYLLLNLEITLGVCSGVSFGFGL